MRTQRIPPNAAMRPGYYALLRDVCPSQIGYPRADRFLSSVRLSVRSALLWCC